MSLHIKKFNGKCKCSIYCITAHIIVLIKQFKVCKLIGNV